MLLRHAVAILATLLTLGISLHAWRQRSFGTACLALWMASLAATAWMFTLPAGADGRLPALARLLLPLCSTPAGPLMYGYVLHAVRGKRLHWAWFLPFAAHAVAAIIWGTQLVGVVTFKSVIWLEYVCLVAAWVVWVRGRGAGGERLASGWVLAAATALALANFAQTLAVYRLIDFTIAVQRAPFVVVCAWTVVAIGFALLESPVFRRLAPELAPRPDHSDRALFERLSSLVAERRAFSDPDFDVSALARLADTHANAVSRALSRAGGTTFYDFVNGFRVREAARLLADPHESRFKIEALGRQAGFRARSTFFKLFRQHTGQTPSEYRDSRNRRLDA